MASGWGGERWLRRCGGAFDDKGSSEDAIDGNDAVGAKDTVDGNHVVDDGDCDDRARLGDGRMQERRVSGCCSPEQLVLA